jgi:cystathionine beta-lyase/cystathionine gamma-synthase
MKPNGKPTQNWLGGLMRPLDAFLATQEVKTLPLRMRQHSRSAQLVAEFLQPHPAVARVRYGGLASWNRTAGSVLRRAWVACWASSGRVTRFTSTWAGTSS